MAPPHCRSLNSRFHVATLRPLAMAFRILLPLLLLPFLFAAAAAAGDVAQGPTAPPEATNLTSILAKGEQYTTLLRLLNSTRVDEQLASQLNNSYDGLTFFAPTDAAFAKLRAGALNALNDQQQVQLVLYHVLPRYYSLSTFQTASNPLRTEASGPGGAYGVNVTASTENSLVNVSTGLADVPISNTMFAEFPLAVYSVDEVLMPEQLLGGTGNKSGEASAPAPAQAGTKAGKKGAVPKADVAAAPVAAGPAGTEEEDDESTNTAAGSGCVEVEWSTVAVLALTAVVVNVVVA